MPFLKSKSRKKSFIESENRSIAFSYFFRKTIHRVLTKGYQGLPCWNDILSVVYCTNQERAKMAKTVETVSRCLSFFFFSQLLLFLSLFLLVSYSFVSKKACLVKTETKKCLRNFFSRNSKSGRKKVENPILAFWDETVSVDLFLLSSTATRRFVRRRFVQRRFVQ